MNSLFWQCARKVIEGSASTRTIKYEPLPQDDPKQRRPDISKARRLLGWEPKVATATNTIVVIDFTR